MWHPWSFSSLTEHYDFSSSVQEINTLTDFSFQSIIRVPCPRPYFSDSEENFDNKDQFGEVICAKWWSLFVTFWYKFLTDAVFLTSEDVVLSVKDVLVKFQIPESFVSR